MHTKKFILFLYPRKHNCDVMTKRCRYVLNNIFQVRIFVKCWYVTFAGRRLMSERFVRAKSDYIRSWRGHSLQEANNKSSGLLTYRAVIFWSVVYRTERRRAAKRKQKGKIKEPWGNERLYLAWNKVADITYKIYRGSSTSTAEKVWSDLWIQQVIIWKNNLSLNCYTLK